MNDDWENEVDDFLKNQREIRENTDVIISLLTEFYQGLVDRGMPEKTAESLTIAYLNNQFLLFAHQQTLS